MNPDNVYFFCDFKVLEIADDTDKTLLNDKDLISRVLQEALFEPSEKMH